MSAWYIEGSMPSNLRPSRARLVAITLAGIVCILTFGCRQVSAWEQTPVGVAPVSTDPSTFLSAESAVRHDFLERYPPKFPTLPANLQGKFRKMMADAKEEELFSIAFADAIAGKAQAPNAKKPGYWSGILVVLVTTQTPGTTLGLRVETALSNRLFDTDEKEIDKLAKRNMENFKLLVTSYDAGAAQAFDASSPMQKVQYILDAFKSASNDIRYPCPYTVYLLDQQPLDPDSDDSDTKPTKGQDAAETDLARLFVGRLGGKNTPDYVKFSSYSREQKTVALKVAFSKFIDTAISVAHQNHPESVATYLQSLGGALVRNDGEWDMVDDSGKQSTDKELVLKMFGKEESKRFDHMPEGPEKNSTREAAILLFTQSEIMIWALTG